MCDRDTTKSVLSFAHDYLLPPARDHVLPILKEAADMIRGVPRKVAGVKAELESIEDFINDADGMAEAEEDNTRQGIKAKVKQLREESFRMEDVIDEYAICEGQEAREGRAAAAGDLVKTMFLRLQLAHKIQNIKSRRDGFQIQSPSEQGPSSSSSSSSSRGNKNATLRNLREAPLYMEEGDVVGFEAPRAKLIDWLVKGRAERTVISVEGMGGQGKTTLAQKVFDSNEVTGNFKCRAWITVSQTYTVEGLMRDMLVEFSRQIQGNPPQGYLQMDRQSLTTEVRKYLQDKRYVVLFDDVWNKHFWNEFEFALIDNKKGSRVFITTRNTDVAAFCKRSSFVQVHDLKPLDPVKSLELFYKKAFFDLNGLCPENLVSVSSEIVEKCEGLPLAIVAVGGLLSTRDREPPEWQSFSENLSSELDNNPDLTAVTKILGFSFHDLPYHLKRCFLYLGIYPEDFEVKTLRLIQQWVAEGFVKDETGKTVEEVAEQYLTELIRRSLVQVSSLASDGKTRSCRVHDLIRQMILDKIQELSFCHFASENADLSVLSGMIRRLTIATSSNNLMASVECSSIRSLHVFRNENLPDSFMTTMPSKYRLLKVLDFEDVPLYHYVPKNLGDLFHLRYLSFRNTKVTNLPGSIGMLHNLETLDLRQTMVRKMPREINKLRKLRHLLAYDKSKGVGHGIQLQDGIGNIEPLQTLREVEVDYGGVELITELERLTQLRKLGLTNVRQEYTSSLCSSVNKMQHLEKLYISAINEHEAIDLHFDVSLPKLRKLRLIGKLDRFQYDRFPYWVRELQNLVKLSLSHSMLTHDPFTSLKDLPNLLYLSILYRAYEDESLQFPDKGFRKLKQLVLRRLYNLNSITIGGGALSSLEKFKLVNIPQLKEVPSGVYSLPNLQVFHAMNMSDEFEQSIDRGRGQHHWIIEQVPFVSIVERDWGHEKKVQLW